MSNIQSGGAISRVPLQFDESLPQADAGNAGTAKPVLSSAVQKLVDSGVAILHRATSQDAPALPQFSTGWRLVVTVLDFFGLGNSVDDGVRRIADVDSARAHLVNDAVRAMTQSMLGDRIGESAALRAIDVTKLRDVRTPLTRRTVFATFEKAQMFQWADSQKARWQRHLPLMAGNVEGLRNGTLDRDQLAGSIGA